MKALILAGGYATRLRPLSFSRPKLLFPILGRSILERTLEKLYSLGVDEVILAVNYLADLLKRHFGKRYDGVKIRYSLEEEALGTGGPIKKAEKMLKGEDYFFTLNGDVIFDLEIKEMLRSYEERAVATIALYEVEDPSRFGVAVLDEEMYIEKFVEKPEPGHVESRLINAGVYLLTPKIFNYIPAGRNVSMETEVFPTLAEERRLLGFKYNGEWYDIGKIEDYISVNYDHLDRSSFGKPLIQDGTEIPTDTILKVPAMICKGTIIGGRSMIGPYVIIGEGSILGSHVRIEDSILFNNVKVGSRARLERCVLGDGVELGEEVHIGRDVVIGDAVKVRDGVKIVGSVKICPFKEITKDVLEPCNIL